MNSPARQPYSRSEFAGALVANAAAKPFNIVLLIGTMGAGVLVGGTVAVALLVALVVYAIAVARTFLDEDEAEAVLTRERAERRAGLKAGTRQLDPATLAPEVGRHLLQARAIEERIRNAIERAELPYEEVSTEVDALVSLMELSASRAHCSTKRWRTRRRRASRDACASSRARARPSSSGRSSTSSRCSARWPLSWSPSMTRWSASPSSSIRSAARC